VSAARRYIGPLSNGALNYLVHGILTSGTGGLAPLPANGPAANVSAARRYIGPLGNGALNYLIHGILTSEDRRSCAASRKLACGEYVRGALVR
jgi:hypothetical protein